MIPIRTCAISNRAAPHLFILNENLKDGRAQTGQDPRPNLIDTQAMFFGGTNFQFPGTNEIGRGCLGDATSGLPAAGMSAAIDVEDFSSYRLCFSQIQDRVHYFLYAR